MVIACVVLVGGCSTDVTRFDFPFFGLTGKNDTTGSLPTPPEPIARNERYDAGPPRGAGLGDTARGYTPPPYRTSSWSGSSSSKFRNRIWVMPMSEAPSEMAACPAPPSDRLRAASTVGQHTGPASNLHPDIQDLPLVTICLRGHPIA
jgi:hypothetical protein